MQKIRQIRAIVAIGLLPVILGLFFNAATNQHIHRLPDGQLIQHAHPFKSEESGSPVQKHHHSQNELFWLALIAKVLSLLILLTSLVLALLHQARKKHVRPPAPCLLHPYHLTQKGRAPPLKLLP